MNVSIQALAEVQPEPDSPVPLPSILNMLEMRALDNGFGWLQASPSKRRKPNISDLRHSSSLDAETASRARHGAAGARMQQRAARQIR